MIRELGKGGVRQNTTDLYPIYYADSDMFRPLGGQLQVTKICIQENNTEYDRSVSAYSKLYNTTGMMQLNESGSSLTLLREFNYIFLCSLQNKIPG